MIGIPIGIAGVPQAADEYDRYVGQVAQMVEAGSSISDLSEHLVRIEVDDMGLRGNHDRARSVAAKLRSIAHEPSASSSTCCVATCRDRFANAINFRGFPTSRGMISSSAIRCRERLPAVDRPEFSKFFPAIPDELTNMAWIDP